VLGTGGREAVRRRPGAATFVDEQEIQQFLALMPGMLRTKQ